MIQLLQGGWTATIPTQRSPRICGQAFWVMTSGRCRWSTTWWRIQSANATWRRMKFESSPVPAGGRFVLFLLHRGNKHRDDPDGPPKEPPRPPRAEPDRRTTESAFPHAEHREHAAPP